jgi:hypothetical protein
MDRPADGAEETYSVMWDQNTANIETSQTCNKARLKTNPHCARKANVKSYVPLLWIGFRKVYNGDRGWSQTTEENDEEQ